MVKSKSMPIRIIVLLVFWQNISAFQNPKIPFSVHRRPTSTSASTNTIATNSISNRGRAYTSTSKSAISSKSSIQRQMSNDSSSMSTSKSTKKKKKKKKRRLGSKSGSKSKSMSRSMSGTSSTLKNPLQIVTWRIFGVEVDPDLLGESALLLKQKQVDSTPTDQIYLSQPVLDALLKRLKIKNDHNGSIDIDTNTGTNTDTNTDTNTGTRHKNIILPTQLKGVRMVRRSLDARKKKLIKEGGPRYTYVLDIDLTKQATRDLKLKNQPGRNEVVTPEMMNMNMNMNTEALEHKAESDGDGDNDTEKKTVIIVGAGPAGLFCALRLAQSNKNITPILLERGQAVESRGKDIGALIHRKTMNSESNFAFGEGGAGTWSDGKLTTRIGRNSRNVRTVLETFVKYGAPDKILVEGAPHLGTDNLVKLLRNMRVELRALGGQVHFGAKMTNIIFDGDRVKGVQVTYSTSEEKGMIHTDNHTPKKEEGSVEEIMGDAVVLATGHSARDVYQDLFHAGVKLEPKGFAAGFRVEHPQRVINKIQYGDTWGRNAYSGKASTDDQNQEYFDSFEMTDKDKENKLHNGRLPVPSYRLATDKAFDGESNRGAYSFCMCPGGQIVPASTEENEVCVNGMSFSRRDSQWANAALVVTVSPDDPVLDEYRDKYGVLAGIEFQRDMERKASVMGGGDFTVPVQRLTDFVKNVSSTTAPSSSYRLGVKPSPCHEIYPEAMTRSLQDAVKNHFDQQMPGFLCEDALLHAVETRTSSPVRICRDPETMQAIGKHGLYPSGEGAGFAGGIVSAAVDGLVVAESVMDDLTASISDPNKSANNKKREKSVGFEY